MTDHTYQHNKNDQVVLKFRVCFYAES